MFLTRCGEIQGVIKCTMYLKRRVNYVNFIHCFRSKDLESSCDAAALQGVGLQAVVTEYLITYADLIFSDKLPSFSGDSLQSKLINPNATFSFQRLL